MELLESLLGMNDRRDDFDFADLFRMFFRWILGCGCLIVIGVGGLIYWISLQGENIVTVGVVIITMIVAVASLIRSSMG